MRFVALSHQSEPVLVVQVDMAIQDGAGKTKVKTQDLRLKPQKTLFDTQTSYDCNAGGYGCSGWCRQNPSRDPGLQAEASEDLVSVQ